MNHHLRTVSLMLASGKSAMDNIVPSAYGPFLRNIDGYFIVNLRSQGFHQSTQQLQVAASGKFRYRYTRYYHPTSFESLYNGSTQPLNEDLYNAAIRVV